jgi:serine/threonine protein kinase
MKPESLQPLQLKALHHPGQLKAKKSLEDWAVGEKYKVNEIIGKGSYATVCEGVNTVTGERVAIKKFINIFRSEMYALRVLREVVLLRNLHHPCIIGSLDIIIQGDKDHFTTLYLVLEYFPKDLKKLFESN